MNNFGTPPAPDPTPYGENPRGVCVCKWYRRFCMEVSKEENGQYYWAWHINTELACDDPLAGSCKWTSWTHLGSGGRGGARPTFYHMGLVKCGECECDAGVGSNDYISDHGFSSFANLPECFKKIWSLTGKRGTPRSLPLMDQIEDCMVDYLKNVAIPGVDMSIPPTDSEMKVLCGGETSRVND